MLKKQLNKIKGLVLGLSSFFINGFTQADQAPSAAAPAVKHAGLGGMIWMPLILIAIFYFLIIRPQNKRQREQRELMNQIALGDEVMTNSGILGRITRLRDNYIVINIAKDTEMTISRSSVSQVLPKGTLESIH
jgi:preprotein translocase subunit YajC